MTEPRDDLGIPKYDLFLAVQDRAFNDDGSINFSNGLGQTPLPPAPAGLGVVGQTPVTPGVNPLVHPTWVPEYFGDHALVNGVLWPKKTVETGWYRIRLVNGSDSRCYTTGFSRPDAGTGRAGTGRRGEPNVNFFVIANDQGYLQNPGQDQDRFTMCPGERYELLVDFGNLGGVPVLQRRQRLPDQLRRGAVPERHPAPEHRALRALSLAGPERPHALRGAAGEGAWHPGLRDGGRSHVPRLGQRAAGLFQPRDILYAGEPDQGRRSRSSSTCAGPRCPPAS